MNVSNIYHGGGRNAPGFSKSSGGGSEFASQWVTLPFTWSPDLSPVVPIPAPANGAWSATRQGYFFGSAYVLKEVQILYNKVVTLSTGMTATFNLRQLLADGSVPPSSVIYSKVTTFGQSGAAGYEYYGDGETGLNIVVPAGYNIYGSLNATTTTDLDGVSVWALFQRDIE